MELIQIDLKWLKNQELNINEYLALLKLYKNKDLPYNIGQEEITSLVDSGYIHEKDEGNYGFTMKVFVLFRDQPEDDLFEEFYGLFPHKVPDGGSGYRPTSTTDPHGISGKRTKKIWDRVVGKNVERQLHVIRCLRVELKYRFMKNTLMYLNNIDTWLRQAKWEEWEYLVAQEKQSENQGTTTTGGMKKL